ncbi:hypothetical protein ACKKBG_A20270 [Auxenochlorella protothecoides x Auxenochlorella symbiontica]
MTVNPAPPPVDALLLDLDDTLYDVPAMKAQVAANIQAYMVKYLGVPQEEVYDLCFKCYMQYGTTMAGLVAQGYKIDADHWHAEVHHSLPYEQYLRRDAKLRSMLQRIPLPKYIFTNADRKHARICLDLLGVADCFQGVVAFEDVQAAAAARGWARHGRPVVCKPEHQAYLLALEATGLHPARTGWFDDSTRNVAAGKRLGMFTVLVGRIGVEGAGADVQLASIHDMPAALPWLFEGGEERGPARGAAEAEPCEPCCTAPALAAA